MNISCHAGRQAFLAVSAVFAMVQHATAQTAYYRLLETSQVVLEPCEGLCDCISPPIVGPLAGGFDLSLVGVGDVFDAYNVERAVFRSRLNQEQFKFTGVGSYRDGTHTANLHQMDLAGDVRRGGLSLALAFNSEFDSPIGTLFPDINIDVPSELADCSIYTFRIRAVRTCQADVNYDGIKDSQDYFDFLAAFFSGDDDYNRDGGTDSQDYFDFLNDFLGSPGCVV